jgi:hypothetical protein
MVLCFALGPVVLGLGLLSQAGGDGGSFEEVLALLRRRSGEVVEARPVLVSRLAALGAPAVPALYELATGRSMELLAGTEWRPEAWLCLPEEIPELCTLALASAPKAAVLAHLTATLDAGPEVHERLVLARVLGSLGSSDGLALWLRIAAELGDPGLQGPSVRAALRSALATILLCDARSFEVLAPLLEGLEAGPCAVLVEALGACGRSRGMGVLERLLEAGKPQRTHVLAAMAELEESRPWQHAGRTMARCAPLLRSPDASERALAARLAGSLHDLRSVPSLIALVEDSDAVVRRCAAAALGDMARLPLGEEVEAWESWYAREASWRDEHWNRLLGTLAGSSPGPANEALCELVRHPLFRHEAARAIADTLREQPPAVALAACRELEGLGSPWALPGLVATLGGAQAQLGAAVWRTLRRLSGEELELEPTAWSAWIGAS